MNTIQLKRTLQPVLVLRTESAIAALAFFFVSIGTILVPVAATPGLQRPEPAASAAALAAADAFDLLRSLNERGEMVPSFLDQKRGYKGLDKKNCFGIRIEGGARIVGESAGKDYGMYEMGQSIPMKVTAVQIGFLYSEADLAIGTAALPKGPYMVFLAPEKLTFKGKELKSSSVPLPSRVSDSILSSKKPPRFSLAQDAEGISLVVEGNRLLLQPK
jgi:hypothetical protein